MAARGNHSRRGSGGGAAAIKIILLLCVVLVMVAAGSTLFSGRESPVAESAAPVTPTPPAEPVDNLVTSPDTQPSAPALTPNAEPSPRPSADAPRPPAGTAAAVGADIAVPASAAVDDGYFADAVFVGNSRTQGLQMYGGVTGTTFWTKVGLTVSSAATDRFVVLNNQWLTVSEALAQASYNKVYIMLGMNELGWVYESVYKDDYGKLIDVIQSTHPDATIYIQSIIPVSHWKETSDSDNGTYTNANVIRLQTVLVELCKEKGVNYVNVAEVMQDTDGCLFPEATQDGTHLTAEYCKIWMDYLRTHTVQ